MSEERFTINVRFPISINPLSQPTTPPSSERRAVIFITSPVIIQPTTPPSSERRAVIFITSPVIIQPTTPPSSERRAVLLIFLESY